MNFAAYLATFPQMATDYQAWFLQLPNNHHILVTCEDDPSVPLPTDERIAIGLYKCDEQGDCLDDCECVVVTWAEAIDATHRLIAKAGA